MGGEHALVEVPAAIVVVQKKHRQAWRATAASKAWSIHWAADFGIAPSCKHSLEQLRLCNWSGKFAAKWASCAPWSLCWREMGLRLWSTPSASIKGTTDACGFANKTRLDKTCQNCPQRHASRAVESWQHFANPSSAEVRLQVADWAFTPRRYDQSHGLYLHILSCQLKAQSGPSWRTMFINSQSSLCTQRHRTSGCSGQHLALASKKQEEDARPHPGGWTTLAIWESIIQLNTLVHSPLGSAGSMHLMQLSVTSIHMNMAALCELWLDTVCASNSKI